MILTKKQVNEIIDNVLNTLMSNEYKAEDNDELVAMSVLFTLDELNLEYEDLDE